MQERKRTHEAATTAAEESARLAMKAQQHSARLRDEARQEREQLAQQNKKDSFSQKASWQVVHWVPSCDG
jgi:uncharacterized protein (DUF2345 family)